MHFMFYEGGNDGAYHKAVVAFPHHTLGFGSRSLAKSHPSNNVSSMEERVDAGEANLGMVGASMELRMMFLDIVRQ